MIHLGYVRLRGPPNFMEFVNNAVALLKLAGKKVPPAAIAALAILLPLAVLAFLWMRKTRAAKAAASTGDAVTVVGPAPVAAPVALHRKALVKVWDGFLRGLPSVYRRSITRFQPVLVLGAAGAGKSRLVDACTDWQSQARQFLGSAQSDPNLQVYVGSTVLGLELGARVLADTSGSARDGLVALFRKAFRHTRPVVVVVLDLSSVAQQAPDALKALADTLRGKVNLLSQVARAPLEIRVALTRVDALEGYAEFARFAAKHQVPLSLELPALEAEGLPPGALASRLRQFERYLPLALTHLSAPEYLKVVAFLREAPERLEGVSAFLSTLGARVPLARGVKMERLYLAPPMGEQAVANPMTAAAETRAASYNPLRWHRVVASVVAAAGCAWFVAGYLREDRVWQPALEAAAKYPSAHGPEQERSLRLTMERFRDRKKNDPLLKYFPGSHTYGQRRLDGALTEGIRTRIILPGLEDAFSLDWPHRRVPYFLALLHASRDNALGKLVLANLPHWSEATGLERELISQYVTAAAEPWGRPVALDRLPSRGGSGPVVDSEPWLLYFRRLDQALADGLLNPVELTSLSDEAGTLLEALAVQQKYELAAAVLAPLDEVTGHGYVERWAPFREDLKSREMFRGSHATVERLLRMLRGTRLEHGQQEPVLLSELNTHVKLLLERKSEATPEIYALRVGEDAFRYDSESWASAVRNTQLEHQVAGFLRGEFQQEGRSMFFKEDDQPDPVVMNRYNDGSYLFTGRASLDGRYTRAAFDRYVRPVLAEHAVLLPKMALSPEVKQALVDVVQLQVQFYAARYAEEMDHYYGSYAVKAYSVEAVQTVFKQMLRPGSPFSDLLRVTLANTRLELDEQKNPWLGPMAEALIHYAPLHKAMAEHDGYSELQKFRDLIEATSASMTAAPAQAAAAVPGAAAGAAAPAGGKDGVTAAAPTAAPADAPRGLVEMLSPPGKMALAMLNGEPDSHLDLVTSWLGSVGITGRVARPFLAASEQLYTVGLREVEQYVSEAWTYQMRAELAPALTVFPFDRKAAAEISPDELRRLFHPQGGKWHELRRKFIDPVSVQGALGTRSKAREGRTVQVPADLYPTLDSVDRLVRALWDAEGRPLTLKVKVAPVPFDTGAARKSVLSLVYLNSGSSSIFNFNQQPSARQLEVPWERVQRSQLGIELTQATTGEKFYPTPISVEDSRFSLHKLINKGTQEEKALAWTIPGRDGELPVTVRFELQEDPWEMFNLRPVEPAGPRAALLGAP